MKSKAWQYDGAFVGRRLEMLQSPAWKAASRSLKAFLEELEIEHLRHKGCANGQLARSYTQFIAAGFNRHTVTRLIRTAEALGFIKVNRDSGIGRAELRDAYLYTLTYLPTGVARNLAPTDDWKRIRTDEQAQRIVEKFAPPKDRSERTRRAA